MDNYEVSVRVWQPDRQPLATVLILHGVVSHSQWLTPIAKRLAQRGMRVLCPDRRGAGLNESASGDAPSAEALVCDVGYLESNFRRENEPMHIAGFCWGASYAIHCATRMPGVFSSLMLLAPSIFPVRDIIEKDIVSGESGIATEVPLVPIDRFTSGPAYEEYIIPDPLRTRRVSPRFNDIMIRMTSMLAPRWIKLQLPSLLIMAKEDRLSDNEKHKAAYDRLRALFKQKHYVAGGHGIQFDAPDACVSTIVEWLERAEFC